MHRIGTAAVLMLLMWGVGMAQATTEGWELYTSMRKINVLLPEKGVLWAGTEGGVFRFDLPDSTYATYTTLQGLAGNNVLSMVRDKTGALWFGTDGDGLSHFIEGRGFVATYTEFQGDRINALYAYEDKLFVGTGKNGVSVFIPDRQEIKESYQQLGAFPRNVEVSALTVFSGQLWVGTAEGVAFASLDHPNLLDPDSWTSITLMLGVYAFVSSDSTIYVAGDRGIYSMKDGKWSRERLPPPKATGLAQSNGELVAIRRKVLFRRQGDTWVQDPTLPEAVGLIAASPDSGLWIGIEEDGLIYRKGDREDVIEPKIGPPGNVFTDLTVDPQGVLWAATSRRDEAFEGVYRFDGTTWSQYRWSGPQRSNAVVAVNADRQGRIWVATWGKGVVLLEDDGTPDISADRDRLINQYNSPLNPTVDLSFVVANGFAQDQAGNMWMLNYMSEGSMLSTPVTPLIVIDDFPATQSQVFTLDDGLPGGECSAVAADSAGRIWFGTRNAGFAVIDLGGTPFSKEDDRVTRFSIGSPSELTSNNVQDIAVDREGVVWVATDDGVHALTGSVASGEGYVVTTWDVYGKDQGLGSSIVNAVLVDEANNKWFGTAGGLSRLSARDASIVTYTRANSGLVDDNIQALAIDRRNGRLWIGTAHGLSAFRTSTSVDQFDASAIRAFPNPFILSERGGRVSFGELPDHARVQIFTAAGERVRVVRPDSPAGRWAHWDGGNEAGFLVGSGVYLYVVRTPSGVLLTGKLAVIR